MISFLGEIGSLCLFAFVENSLFAIGLFYLKTCPKDIYFSEQNGTFVSNCCICSLVLIKEILPAMSQFDMCVLVELYQLQSTITHILVFLHTCRLVLNLLNGVGGGS